MKIIMQPRYICYFLKYIHVFIIEFCPFTPVEEKELEEKQLNSQAVETLSHEGSLAKYNADF